jgi:hypothetical protein
MYCKSLLWLVSFQSEYEGGEAYDWYKSAEMGAMKTLWVLALL